MNKEGVLLVAACGIVAFLFAFICDEIRAREGQRRKVYPNYKGTSSLWHDFFKLFWYAFQSCPPEQPITRGKGVTNVDAIPDIRTNANLVHISQLKMIAGAMFPLKNGRMESDQSWGVMLEQLKAEGVLTENHLKDIITTHLSSQLDKDKGFAAQMGKGKETYLSWIGLMRGCLSDSCVMLYKTFGNGWVPKTMSTEGSMSYNWEASAIRKLEADKAGKTSDEIDTGFVRLNEGVNKFFILPPAETLKTVEQLMIFAKANVPQYDKRMISSRYEWDIFLKELHGKGIVTAIKLKKIIDKWLATELESDKAMGARNPYVAGVYNGTYFTSIGILRGCVNRSQIEENKKPVEERWNAPFAADECGWIPCRPPTQNNTRS